jgi:hypothetical protein
MVKRLLIGGLLGGLALFVWQALWWSVFPPVAGLWHAYPDGQAVVAEYEAQGLDSGIYRYPDISDGFVEGPTLYFAIYQAGGFDQTSPAPFIQGLLLDISAALMMTLVLGALAVALPRFGQRLMLCIVLGCIGILSGPLVFGSFVQFPAGLMLAILFDAIIGWTLCGLVISAATKPAQVRTT